MILIMSRWSRLAHSAAYLLSPPTLAVQMPCKWPDWSANVLSHRTAVKRDAEASRAAPHVKVD